MLKKHSSVIYGNWVDLGARSADHLSVCSRLRL
jgi:hypothetical protein